MASDPGARAASPGSGVVTAGEAAGSSSTPPDAAGDLPGRGVLIVGYGNPLRSDDGVGPVIAERLASDPRFAGADIRAEHQLTPELALDASQSWLLVLIDAAAGVAAGEVVIRELAPTALPADAERGQAGRIEEGGPPLTHHVDPSALLGLAAELWGAAPRAVTVGIGPVSFELGEELTPAVNAAVPRAIDVIAEALAGLRGAPSGGGAGES